jgi:hypothetical protein
MTTRVEVDFNSRDDWGRIPAPLADIEGPLRLGDAVEAYDEEGNRCTGFLAAVEGEYALIDPTWATFTPPDRARVALVSTVGCLARQVTGLSIAVSLGVRPSATTSGDFEGSPTPQPRFSDSPFLVPTP